MKDLHRKYGLKFVKRGPFRFCDSEEDRVDILAVNLSTYLSYLQFPDNIIEEALPEVNKVLNCEPFEDISEESISVTMTAEETSLEWYGRTGFLPTKDFKLILEEFVEFLLG